MKLAFIFPGQGSQSVGMMSGFAELGPVKDTFSEASDLLGEDLWLMAEQGPVEAINLTTNTQPLMLVAGVAVWRAWNAVGGAIPEALAGHSLGEYSALVATGSMKFADAVSLVRFRAQSMQDAVPTGTGAMAAILGMDDDNVRAACVEACKGEEIVEAANFNAPGQVVVAGHKPAVERAIEIARKNGAKRAVLVAMSVPSHCGLMKPASDRLRERLQTIELDIPRIPVIQNVDVVAVADPDAICDALVRQLFQPVRWVETIQALMGSGVTNIIECGPGRVLLGLNKRIGGAATTNALTDAASLQQLAATLGG